MDAFTKSYTECMMGFYNIAALKDIAPDTLKRIIESCADFKKANAGNLQGIPPNKAGAAFFLSRHGYGDDPWALPLWVGAGRPNGDDKRAFLETIAKRLTVAAVASGSLDLEKDNEGEWYLT